MSARSSISLVLGSGGARGLAHIGVIRWLQEREIHIASIAGSSMGALVGGIYALGKLDEFTEWVTAIDRMEIVRLLDFSFTQGGLFKGDKIIETLQALSGDQLIEDLPISFTAVASDVANEKEIWISRGPVYEAIRASISLPMFFTPVVRNGVQLMDGGILNPVPIAPIFRDHTDFSVAVNLSAPPDPAYFNSNTRPRTPSSERSSLSRKIDSFIDSLVGNHHNSGRNGMMELACQAVDAMQGVVARQKLAAYPPDVIVEVPRNICGVMEFDRAQEIIELGYQFADTQLGRARQFDI